MINQPPPELFPSERPVQSTLVKPKSYRIRRSMTVFVALALIGGGSYEIYLWKRTPPLIPTIHAEGALKQKPEQPGGIDIPNQDVTAYQQIDGNEAKPASGEHLMPPPETPQASAPAPVPPPVEAAPMGSTSVENLIAQPQVPIQTTVSPPAKAVAEPPPAPATIAEAPSPQPTPDPSAQKAEAVAEPAPTPSPAAPAFGATPKTSSAGKGGYRVQLASIPDEEMAKQEMRKMQDKYAAQLNGSKLHLVKADLGPRGIYYRVQSVNPMTDGDARDVCTALKNIKAGCIVVKP